MLVCNGQFTGIWRENSSPGYESSITLGHVMPFDGSDHLRGFGRASGENGPEAPCPTAPLSLPVSSRSASGSACSGVATARSDRLRRLARGREAARPSTGGGGSHGHGSGGGWRG